MERVKKITADAVFVIQVLIIFILLFESRILVPAVLQSFGRLHPLLLHLPIGLLLVTVILLYTRRYFDEKSLDELTGVLLHFTALTASLTTLMGLFLSLEGAFGAEQLWLHKWLGVALSFLCWGMIAVRNNLKLLKSIGLAGVILLIFTGHYGANLTHGEDFVWAPLQEDEPRVARVITDSTSLFAATIEPIIESKCYGCHNAKKAKGNLVLTSLESMMKGGETGALWKAEDPANSLIVERLLLPVDHDDHMPPKDKAQLSAEEISFISLWIGAGADTDVKLKDVAPEDTLGRLASIIVPRYIDVGQPQQKYTFAFASVDKIRALSRPNRSVFQIARNEPAIQADFYLRETFERKHLEELLGVKEQLIAVNLSKMPVQDADLDVISKFQNLEVLNLNNTVITGAGLKALASLPKLRSLSLSGTDVSAGILRDLAKVTTLEEVYVWNTPVSANDIASLSKEFPRIRWDVGFVPDETEMLKLNPPMLKNKSPLLATDENIVLRHNLPGTVMRYTLDGTEPDSLSSPIFENELVVGNYASLKTKAFKDGWLSSDVAEFIFLRKGHHPDTASLATEPDPRYPGEGTSTLLDEESGLPDFYRHPAWIAFRENDLVLDFAFGDKVPTVRNITLSFAHNPWASCMPPGEMQLWGGDDATKLKLIASVNSEERPKPPKPRIEGCNLAVPPSSYKYYKLVAKPQRKPGERGKPTLWLMVDEVLIN
ncbi:MAG: peptidylprolyl isomerase [Bacteroidota bacterium]|nr:peptidylprolyl isomerase [Bacteroidota bacterium]